VSLSNTHNHSSGNLSPVLSALGSSPLLKPHSGGGDYSDEKYIQTSIHWVWFQPWTWEFTQWRTMHSLHCVGTGIGCTKKYCVEPLHMKIQA